MSVELSDENLTLKLNLINNFFSLFQNLMYERLIKQLLFYGGCRGGRLAKASLGEIVNGIAGHSAA